MKSSRSRSKRSDAALRPATRLQLALASGFHPTYDITKSYEWNYRNGPLFRGPYPPPRRVDDRIRLLDFELNSRLGIAAGPLLNSNWTRLYARLGFDLLSYKTVRTQRRPSNPAPNCVFVATSGQLSADREGETLYAREIAPEHIEDISITNSFGVPSRGPKTWQEDVARAKGFLEPGQVLVVSTMGSSEYHPERGAFVRDFALSARLAQEAGADIVELDLSCPNSNAAEGMVYLDAKLVEEIVIASKRAIQATPLFIKVGSFRSRIRLFEVLRACAGHVEGVVGINTVKMTVLRSDGAPAVPGRPQSGVCGSAIRSTALDFLRLVLEERARQRYDFVVIGVGGIMTPDHIDEFLGRDSIPDAVEMATAAMWDPYLAYRYYLRYHPDSAPPVS